MSGSEDVVSYKITGERQRKRQRTLGRVVRDELDDGRALVELWMSIAMDPARTTTERLRASELLADRGWGKAANFVAQEGDPLGLEDLRESAEEFTRSISRLAAVRSEGTDPPAAPERPSEPGAVGDVPPVALAAVRET